MRKTKTRPRFTPKTEAALRAAGWYPGRSIQIAPTTHSLNAPPSSALKIYSEFGQLAIAVNLKERGWPVTIYIDWNMGDDDILSLNNLDETDITLPSNPDSTLSYLDFTRLSQDKQEEVIKHYIKEHNLTETSFYKSKLGADCTVLGYMNDFKYDGENEYILTDSKGHIYLANDGNLSKVAVNFDNFLRTVTTPKQGKYRFGRKFR